MGYLSLGSASGLEIREVKLPATTRSKSREGGLEGSDLPGGREVVNYHPAGAAQRSGVNHDQRRADPGLGSHLNLPAQPGRLTGGRVAN